MLIIIGISYYKDVTVILVGRRPRMKEPNQLLKPLTEQLMKEVMLYGILEVSTGQYRCVCSSILRFAESAGHPIWNTSASVFLTRIYALNFIAFSTG